MFVWLFEINKEREEKKKETILLKAFEGIGLTVCAHHH